ncbi:MAG TPA: glycosyltransferase family 4 protein [Rhizomicrobium sp.]|nr:glycosyltransferase family 4 protein [Rhizomicrobium sp.]
MSTPRTLHLLLATKERFEPEGAGAFALNVLETSRVSRFHDDITVFGSPVANPFRGVRYQPLAKARWWNGDRNRAMARRYGEFARGARPALIEVYNRPVVADMLRGLLGDVAIVLHLGNDPRSMDGSRSAAERRKLLENSAAIVCVSDYIRRCFLDGIVDPFSRVHVIYTGVPRAPEFPAKDKRIVYAGRVVPEKGVLELVQALARILPHHPDWSAEVIGARWFGAGEKPTAYETSVAASAAQCGQIVLSGFRPHEDVLASLNGASIAVVPSLWDDPFPRTALEALAQACALICSRRGGLPELGPDRACYVEPISPESVSDALENLITDNEHREALQRRGWADFPFDIHRSTSALDDLRERLMSPA